MTPRVSHFRGEVTLCAAPSLKVGGRTFVPDDGKAILDGNFAYALPNISYYGQAMLPKVVANSFQSMLGQVVNREHQMRSYDPESITRDRILGAVLAVEYPPEPEGGWTIATERKDAPSVRVALSIFKAAEGVNTILGKHQTARHKFTLSMEVRFFLEESAWCWRKGAEPVAGAVDLGSGWEGMLWNDAPDDLLACWSMEKNMVDGKWQGRPVVHLAGGFEGRVDFFGLGIVEHGAEPAAKISTIMAALELPELPPDQREAVLAVCSELKGLVEAFAPPV